jgi:predicted RNA-binding Zn-ribbon protein involved in translation (DUF1610 family)
MSDSSHPRGRIYRCPVCGAELAVLAEQAGEFIPRCCDVPMERRAERLTFYSCPLCGAEIGVVQAGTGRFEPRCCDRAMERQAA